MRSKIRSFARSLLDMVFNFLGFVFRWQRCYKKIDEKLYVEHKGNWIPMKEHLKEHGIYIAGPPEASN